MKKKLLFLQLFLFGIFFCAIGQTAELLIDEDFQDWEATPTVQTDSCESFDHQPGPVDIEITLVTGGKATITLIKYAISPLCNSKYVNRGDATENTEGVTTGFVSISKVEEVTDTLGEFIISKLSNVTKIEYGFSCTGSNRGIRLYTSTDDGANWDGPVGGEHYLEGNSQLGVYVEEEINLDNVMLKFTSGLKQSDGTSQNSRIHNILVYGVPGSPETGLTDHKVADLTAYYVPGKGLVIRGDVYETAIYDLMGRMVKRSNTIGNHTLDISDFSDGVYILKATNADGKVYVSKFVKK